MSAPFAQTTLAGAKGAGAEPSRVIDRKLDFLGEGVSAAAPPGSTPARMTPCSRPPSSCVSSKIACLEEIAYHQGWIDRAQLDANIAKLGKSSYAAYLRKMVAER